MRIIFIVPICLLMAVSCGGGGGGTPSDNGTGDVLETGAQDQGTAVDPGNPQDPGPHPEGVDQDDGVQPFDLPSEPGAADGYDATAEDPGQDATGACTTAEDCNDENDCTADICSKGQCKHVCLEGQICDDGSPFSTDDRCILEPVTGQCHCFGQLECARDKDCNDGDPCTDDWCDDNGQCQHDCALGEPCNDGDPGTINDECASSLIEECVCMGTPAECQDNLDCDDGNPCTEDLCTADLKCLHDCLEGASCDDGDQFTLSDKCLSDPLTAQCLCQGTPECVEPADCDDGNQCTKDVCVVGKCVHDCQDGMKCDDGDPGTVSDTCLYAPTGECVCNGGVIPACYTDGDCLAAEEFCQFVAGACKGPGQCAPIPGLCPLVWAPVCGCDGKTYGNSCEAAMVGVSVDYEGECLTALCWSNDMCAKNEYCALPACDSKSGECTLKPAACPDIWAPVCGCDGTTYDNACEAAMAGVSVDFTGPCKI